MALIKCSECNNEVSDKAISCPKCGAPIENNERIAVGEILNTIQETSKKFKLQSLISYLIITIGIIGLIMTNDTNNNHDSFSSYFAITIFIIGVILYIVNQIRIWWHHK